MLNQEQLEKLDKIFKEQILPVINKHPEAFEALSERAQTFLDSQPEQEQANGLDSETALVDLVGEGAHGRVYKLKNADIAIKETKNYPLLKEGRVLHTLQKVKYFPHLYYFDRELIVMEYIHGVRLSEWLENGNSLTDDQALQVFDAYQMCLSLGVKPVELEPDHILLVDGQIRIIDVGMYFETAPTNHLPYLESELNEFKRRFWRWVNDY